MRFSTKELAELEVKIASAADEALAREQAIFEELAAQLLARSKQPLKKLASGLAIDRCGGGARRIGASPGLVAAGGRCLAGVRHRKRPASRRRGGVCAGRGKPLPAMIANLSGLPGKGGRIAIVTGPNMAGKSTYLRQNALIAILAQMGSFVPAARAHIGVVDKLYSRVGAADDLARGRSTFMVEMIETAAILNQAGERSLVILDEIGRGTATFDGLSIAWAVIEHLHEKNRARALFATHFHELTRLSATLDRLDNLTVRVTDWNGEVVFLHEIVPGAADRSYGIQVAKLAGLPAPVVARARTLLAEFEAAERLAYADRSVADLPLFTAAQGQTASSAPIHDEAWVQALDAIDPDALSPRAALETLYRLKKLRAGDG